MRIVSKLVGAALVLASATATLPIRILAKVEKAKPGSLLAKNCGGVSCTMSNRSDG